LHPTSGLWRPVPRPTRIGGWPATIRTFGCLPPTAVVIDAGGARLRRRRQLDFSGSTPHGGLVCAHCLRKNVTGVGSLPHLRCYRRPSV
jgi:hypothetical protein